MDVLTPCCCCMDEYTSSGTAWLTLSRHDCICAARARPLADQPHSGTSSPAGTSEWDISSQRQFFTTLLTKKNTDAYTDLSDRDASRRKGGLEPKGQAKTS